MTQLGSKEVVDLATREIYFLDLAFLNLFFIKNNLRLQYLTPPYPIYPKDSQKERKKKRKMM